MNQITNPYCSPTAKSLALLNPPGPREMLGCLLYWFVFAVGIWFGRTQIVPLYQEFGFPIPAVMLFFTYPLSPFVLSFTGIGFAAGMALARNLYQRRTLQIYSVAATTGMVAVAAYGFLPPLVILITSLN